MATPRSLADYPSLYFDLFEAAASRHVEVILDCEDSARRLRGRLYAFREALFDYGEHAPRAALLASTVRLRVDGCILNAEPLEAAESEIQAGLKGT